MKHFFQFIAFSLILLSAATPAFSQTDTAYQRVADERAGKIVNDLKITDQALALRVKKVISAQYSNLNSLHSKRDALLKSVDKTAADKAATDKKIADIKSASEAEVAKLHKEYLASLGALISPAQIDKVKDGMTYGVVPITYKGYVDMIPTLTEVQKAKIMGWLVEAREHAMDGGSSAEKHGWFGKYKGRINNYLSAEGYDSKKEREEWMKRIKAAEDAKKAEKK
jgi:hypothetical protein